MSFVDSQPVRVPGVVVLVSGGLRWLVHASNALFVCLMISLIRLLVLVRRVTGNLWWGCESNARMGGVVRFIWA